LEGLCLAERDREEKVLSAEKQGRDLMTGLLAEKER
jgi:hypothetical protein